MYRRRNAAFALDEALAAKRIYWHHWRMTKQTAKLHIVANRFAYNGNYTYGGSLLIHHTYGGFVGYYARD